MSGSSVENMQGQLGATWGQPAPPHLGDELRVVRLRQHVRGVAAGAQAAQVHHGHLHSVLREVAVVDVAAARQGTSRYQVVYPLFGSTLTLFAGQFNVNATLCLPCARNFLGLG